MVEIAVPSAWPVVALFDDLVRLHHRRLVALGLALTGSPSAAEELAQEALLAAHRRWDRVGRYADPAAFCRRVVATRSISWQRRRRSEEAGRTRLGPCPVVGTIADGVERSIAVWTAVRRLPRRQAQVVALFYVADLPIEAVARELGIAPGTAKSHLHRALEALRAELEDAR